jgi:hypothetical protein
MVKENIIEFKRSGTSRYDIVMNGKTIGVIFKALIGYRLYSHWRICTCYKNLDAENTLREAKVSASNFLNKLSKKGLQKS